MGFSGHAVLFFVFLIFSSFCIEFITALDTITKSQFIKDPETISSNDSVFKLGFFSPRNSTNRYVGIWYLSESDVIWVANREQPLKDSSGVVAISEDGNLVVMNGEKQVVWLSNASHFGSNSGAKLLDTGNLVLQDDSTGNTIWESFQHPTDAFVEKMSLVTNKITGKKVQLTSWRSPSDPSTGNFSFGLGRVNMPELFIWNKTKPYWRSGPWNGRVFLGVYEMRPSYLYGFNIGREDDGTLYLTPYSSPNGTSNFAILVLNSQGTLVEKNWKNKKNIENLTLPATDCDIYGFCGSFGTCNTQNSPICSCLTGFEPNNTEKWSKQNWKSGCVRRVPLQCERIKNGGKAGKDDDFLKLETTKVPDFAEQSPVSEDTCRTRCLQNCSCTAYAYDAGIGCMSWSGDLVDIQRFTKGGADLYIKVAYSELDKKRKVTVIVVVTVIIGMIIAATCSYFLWALTFKHSADSWSLLCFGCWKRSTASSKLDYREGNFIGDLKQLKLEELPLIEFGILATATDNFHSDNKLGHGGFGSVYRGKLQDGQEIAVKRLSKASEQGLEEFMNEVVVISKLQHRNLVRLLGCCTEGEEKMLIYEYLPNKSLDALLFDPIKKKILDWHKRFNIIEGIVLGLLYLHRDSRLKIIHRDLKASNILLDEELNPKISDFGLARIFGRSEDHVNTRRIVGTYGYISPEYAMRGLFSEKSDVFSFGVLLLEIISGKKNTSFYDDKQSISLLGFAWKLWERNNIVSLIDPEICVPKSLGDIVRCIHIGLLCVQELARDRPSVATVLSMLNSEIVNLPAPRQPAFILTEMSPQISNKTSSINDVTVTSIKGR